MRKEFETSRELRKRLAMAVILSITVGILLMVWGIFQIYSRSGIPTGIVSIAIGMLIFLSAWLTTAIVQTTRLVLTSEKLEFYSPGLVLTTSWDNLERIGRLATYDSLVLRAPATQKTAWWFKLFRNRPEREIPLSMFSNWRRSELGQEIKKYGPNLFSESSSGK